MSGVSEDRKQMFGGRFSVAVGGGCDVDVRLIYHCNLKGPLLSLAVVLIGNTMTASPPKRSANMTLAGRRLRADAPGLDPNHALKSFKIFFTPLVFIPISLHR
jgi:hypothetical protein